VIGPEWICNLEKLSQLVPYAADPEFREAWKKTKHENKKRLSRYILRKVGLGVNPDTLFDVQGLLRVVFLPNL
jgi:starch phosphorylase